MSPRGTTRILEVGRVRMGKQVVLPLSKAIEISLRSLRIRFWRSMVTVSGVILAIAFLVSILISDAIVEKLKASDKPEVQNVLREKGIHTDAAGSEGSPEAKKTKTWLVVLSLLVACIGIINAMLMSVTERFREIGTMKCLGALDSFIVKLFMLESSFQGTVGTVMGIAVGLLLTLISSAISFGAVLVLSNFPALSVLGAVGFAFGVGVVLSVLGAIYPALVAARMEPAVAMRQEF